MYALYDLVIISPSTMSLSEAELVLKLDDGDMYKDLEDLYQLSGPGRQFRFSSSGDTFLLQRTCNNDGFIQ